ncbi:MAG TPA: type II toxin-antitoxin system VapC family toxin [Stellaceae bacterium]|nr:type II toxin-antitoxin system VapC family toxin [Stellaceae bacterium]
MIILDTNVISEVMAIQPSLAVAAWMDETPTFDLATTTINIAEIRYGLARLSHGRRRARLNAQFESLIARAFGTRIFTFDGVAADAYGELVAGRERNGRPLRGPDAFIAAIAASRGLAIATRDTRGFEDCGLELVNPWAD